MKKLILFVLLGILCLSCKDEKRTRSEHIVKEWVGKTIRLPSGVELYDPQGDSAVPIPVDTDYKIFLYTDSTGCTSCKLKPFVWTGLIHEIDSLMPNQVEFLFYFHPKNRKELLFLLKRDGFRYPVFIDTENKIDRLNHFPSEMEFQCFLLDKENKVLSIGNPTLNPKIGDLYKQIMSGGDTPKEQPVTTIAVDQTQMEIRNLKSREGNFCRFCTYEHRQTTFGHYPCGCFMRMYGTFLG